jgi:glutamyl-Q tRNA(Asp) synthetase
MPPPVFRFAPSPNGYLHLGHALSALINFDMACAAGGRFLLRMEDIDRTRCDPRYDAAICEDLAWLGVRWEEPVRRQSAHFDDYAAALARLDSQLGLIYPSFESRGEVARLIAGREQADGMPWPRDPDGAPLYPGNARALSLAQRTAQLRSGKPHALRLDMAAAMAQAGPLTFTETGKGPQGQAGTVLALPQRWGDVVLARKETPTSYHLSVVIDDALQGVTDVVRGRDLFWSTSVHLLLQQLLGIPQPVYRHHRLIEDASGHKLSKSTQATALRELRGRGASPADIRSLVGLSDGFRNTTGGC